MQVGCGVDGVEQERMGQAASDDSSRLETWAVFTLAIRINSGFSPDCTQPAMPVHTAFGNSIFNAVLRSDTSRAESGFTEFWVVLK